jgi:hypothetical protein
LDAAGAIQAVNAHIAGTLHVKASRMNGLILDNATVEQMLDLDHVELGTAGSVASLQRVTAQSGARLRWGGDKGSVNLSDASMGNLVVDVAGWPPAYSLTGLQFVSLIAEPASVGGTTWTGSALQRWLNAQNPLDPSVHGELARSLHAQGRAGDAEAVLIDGLRERRKTLPATKRLSWSMYDALVGYGYRPFRAGLFLLGLIVAVWITLMLPRVEGVLRSQDQAGFLYSTTHRLTQTSIVPALTATNAVQPYNPILFAVDSVVPLLDLGQRTTWHPDTSTPTGQAMQFWLAFVNVGGWILSTVLVLSMTLLARRLT